MLSIQQLIRVLRQNTTQTLADMMSLLSTIESSRQSALMTSSSKQPEHEHACVVQPKQPKQSQQQQIQSNQQASEANVSFRSEVSANGCEAINKLPEAATTTQDTKRTFVQYNNSTTTTPAAFYLCKSVQNSYKTQQQQHFHTQNQQQTNQKQIKFAMSSLAAEPLAMKQTDDLNADEATAKIASDCRSTAETNTNSTEQHQQQQQQQQQVDKPSSSTGKPCFNTGLPEIVKFMELIGNLKHTKRTGWVLRDVNDCESISGHMYRMSMLTFLLDGSEGLNQIRCMELALVHDLAESLVGDITPFCGITKDDKRAMEFKAMEDICKLIEPRGKRIMELFEEYEEGESAESKFVKDLDRLDMIMQAFEYEKRDNCLLKHQEFFDSTQGKFNHPFVKKLVNEIYEQREQLAKAKGAIAPPTIHVPAMELSAKAKALINGHHKQANTACEQNTTPTPTLSNGHTENTAPTMS